MENMSEYMMKYTPEEMNEAAEALVGENLELKRMVDTLRGRLRESRRATTYYHRKYEAALRYRADAETERTRIRQNTVAIVGIAVMFTCLCFVAAACWGWWHG